MFCTKCGATLPEGTTFCTNCGQRMDAAAPAAGTTTTTGYTMPNFAANAANKDSKLLIVALSAVSAIFALVGLFQWITMSVSAYGQKMSETVGLFKVMGGDIAEEAAFSQVLFILAGLLFMVAFAGHIGAAVMPFIGKENKKLAPLASAVMVVAAFFMVIGGFALVGAMKDAGMGMFGANVSVGPSIWVWLAVIASGVEIFFTKNDLVSIFKK